MLIGPRHMKACLWGFENNKGTGHPTHPCSLISALVGRFLLSIISKLAPSEISIFWPASGVERFVGNPEDSFSHDEA